MFSEQVNIKIISVNDVYSIEQWPYFSTCARKETNLSKTNEKTICVLPGDFLAPSLLSSLDKGHGMVDCMNKSGINFVSFGNHEADVELKQIHNRIRESNFTWINSNMRDLPLPDDLKAKGLPGYSIIEVAANNHKRRVALLGLLTEEPSLYQKGAFGGAKIAPLQESAFEWVDRIREIEAPNGGIDAFVPLTHQVVPLDRAFAKAAVAAKKAFPVIIGGHDHEMYFEDVAGSKIIKTGMDGFKIAITELTWLDSSAEKPIVSVQINDAKRYAPDPIVQEAVKNHERLMNEVMKTQLFAIPPVPTFSSQKMRLVPTTVGTFLTTVVREALKIDCTILHAGCIRGNKSYEGKSSFFYGDLMTELPFQIKLVVVQLPGKVIVNAISFSRVNASKEPPVEYGGYLQCDEGIVWNAETNTVTAIKGQPIQAEQLYSVALPFAILQGLDNNQPIVEFVKSYPPDRLEVLSEGAIDLNNLIISYFAKFILYDIIMHHNFDDIDANHDGKISKEELKAVAEREHPGISALLVEKLFKIADEDDSGFIDREEILKLSTSLQVYKK